MPAYTCDPDTELIGRSVLALFENIRYDMIKPILDKHGLNDVDPDGWYPLQDVLDILSDISEQGSGLFDLVSVGISAARLSPIPPEVEALSLKEFLLLYPQLYPRRHRNGDAGEVLAEEAGERHVKMIFRTPYPDDLMYGLMYGFARRFLPKGTPITVFYDPDIRRSEEGGKFTVIHVVWE
ncbi:MAG TPA: hypothetical protein ENI95_13565 [Chloroflexi bacterium]|nr:hypothetical protein [Chloroflexota bacterium]